MKIQVALLGKIDYQEALRLQENLFNLRIQGKIPDTLLLLEHPAVLTVGRSGKDSNILATSDWLKSNGIDIYEVSRGGDVTYHGPGQIVGYPIMDLNNHGRDIHDFVWKLQETIISLLQEEYNLTVRRDVKKYTGVWVGEEKITAIGIAVKNWVTMHGFAFNVNTRLEHFQWIVPCGITDRGVTSLEKILGSPQDLEKVNQQVVEYFCKAFQMEAEMVDSGKLLPTPF
jgi:lipoyl(octanoyl) transferase